MFLTFPGVSDAWIHRPSLTFADPQWVWGKASKVVEPTMQRPHGRHADVMVTSCHISEAGGMYRQKNYMLLLKCEEWIKDDEYGHISTSLTFALCFPHFSQHDFCCKREQSTRPCQSIGSTLKSLYKLRRDIFKNYFQHTPWKIIVEPKHGGLGSMIFLWKLGEQFLGSS